MDSIDTSEQLHQHIHALIAIEPRFAQAYQRAGVPKLRRKHGGFASLFASIVGQQLSGAAAATIFARLEQAGLTTPEGVAAASDAALREQGLSGQKVRYVRSLVAHDIDYVALPYMTDSQVIEVLTAVTGVGCWTAQMYLLFALGRADVLAVDDLAIKVAVQRLFALDERPTPKQLSQLSRCWSPHRSAASLLLWAYYGLER